MRLLDRRLLRVFDSADISQAVWSSFFARAFAGRFELHEPQQLAGLLMAMTRNKFASAAKRERRMCRDHRRDLPRGGTSVDTLADRRPTPSANVASLESLERLRSRLSTEERQLADMRAAGLPWMEIAEQLGGSPHGRRMQLSCAVRRALDSVA